MSNNSSCTVPNLLGYYYKLHRDSNIDLFSVLVVKNRNLSATAESSGTSKGNFSRTVFAIETLKETEAVLCSDFYVLKTTYLEGSYHKITIRQWTLCANGAKKCRLAQAPRYIISLTWRWRHPTFFCGLVAALNQSEVWKYS